MSTGPHTSPFRFVDYARAVAESFAGPADTRAPRPVARCGLNRVNLHDTSHVTGTGTLADPYVWDGTVWGGVENVLVDGYWTLTATAKLVATGTHLIGQGLPKITYAGTGDAIHVHTSRAGDPNTADDNANVTLFQSVENVWLHVAGSATGSAVAGIGIDIDQSHDCLLRNVRVSGRWAVGVQVGNCTNWTLDRVVIAGSDPLNYVWTACDSPDVGLYVHKRAGNSFGAQNGLVLCPWIRFCKQYAYWSDADDFGTTFVAGQISDSGVRQFYISNPLSESTTVIGTDLEDGAGMAPAGLDPNGAPVNIDVRGRSHVFANVHTIGCYYLNDSQDVVVKNGHSYDVYLGTSKGAEINRVFVTGVVRNLDTATDWELIRVRDDQTADFSKGFGTWRYGDNCTFCYAHLAAPYTTAGGFEQLPAVKLSDRGNRFNDTTHAWTCAVTGTYLITAKMRVADGTAFTNYGVGAAASAGAGDDSDAFLWGSTNYTTASGGNRNGISHTRMARLNAGDTLVLYLWTPAPASVASAILSVSQITA